MTDSATSDSPMTEPPASASPSPHEPRALRWGRAIAFVLALVWIVGPPFYRQILHGKNKHARAWVMFSGIGIGAVDARFYAQLPDGTRRELDRFAELGSKRPVSARKRRIRGEQATWGIARQLCRKLGDGADVRVVARRGTRDGWVVDDDGESNVCAAPPPRQRRQGGGRGKSK
jgi:hypothetical protein